MTITELIKSLESIRSEHGDIDAFVYDFCFWDDELVEHDPDLYVTQPDCGTPVLILNA